MTEIEPMDEARAREILGKAIANDGLNGPGISFAPKDDAAWLGENSDFVGGRSFTADELEAIAWWIRNHATPQEAR